MSSSTQEKATVTPDGVAKYSVVRMCGWLGVSTSGCYEWRGRPASATAARRGHLKLLVAAVFAGSDGTCGHRRVHAQLVRWGEHTGLELVRGLMRELGLVACQPRPWRHSLTAADAVPVPIPDLVRRDFAAEAPGERMVGDVIYIPTLARLGLCGDRDRLIIRKRWWGGRWTTTTGLR